MTTASELHEVNLVSSGKLKLRATALLAEGGEQATFDACVFFHEAARFERRAVEALSHCPPETRLAASIEECWCLVEGRDPHGAADVWSRILEERERVEEATATAMLARLAPRYERLIADFAELVRECRTLERMRQGGRLTVPTRPTEAKEARKELRKILKRFPGLAALWAHLGHLEDSTGSHQAAFDMLQRALQLTPDHPQYQALSLVAAVEGLPRARADEYLRQNRPKLKTAKAEVCLMYAFAEVLLAPKTRDDPDRWRRALEAVNLAFPQVSSEGLRRNMTALKLFLEDKLAKRQTDPQLLYRAGLGKLAATRPPDFIQALLEDTAARVHAMEAPQAAA